MANTPLRMIRIKEDVWLDYEKLCEEEGISRSEDIRHHVKSRIASKEVDFEIHSA